MADGRTEYRIAILGEVEFALATALLRGAEEYAASRRGWRLLPLHYSQEGALGDLLRAGTLDGVIGPLISDRWIRAFRGGHRLPMVNTSSASAIFAAPSVVPDDTAIGREAAAHFLRRRFQHLAFVGHEGSGSSTARRKGFQAAAAREGLAVRIAPALPMTGAGAAWEAWVRNLPAPVAVFCADDLLARRVIQACRAATRAVPEEVAVAGVGDSPLDSFFAGVDISSIPLPMTTVGWEAARVMESLLAGRRPEVLCLRVPPQEMVARKSTSVMRGAHPLVGRALAYIEAHRSHPLSVEDVARGVGASRRLLEMRFRESLNRSPRREIQAHRMAQAAQLLKQTRLPVADVAAHCGYLELSHFYACFAREYGRPPAAWRREQLAGPSAAPLLKKRR